MSSRTPIAVIIIANQDEIIARVSNKDILDEILSIIISNVNYQMNYKKIIQASPKTYDHNIQLDIDGGILFLTVSIQDFPQRICFSLINSLKAEWFDRIANSNKSQKQIEKLLKEYTEKYSNDKEVDKIRALNGKIEQITEIMQENMEAMLVQQEKNQVISEKARNLEQRSLVFKKKAKKTRWKMFWRNLFFYFTCCGVCAPCCNSCRP